MVVLDSSAIVAVILNEPGAALVAKVLENAAVSMPNVAEAYAVISSKTGSIRAVDAFFALKGIKTIPLSFAQAKVAGLYEAIGKTAGLSLGDRCCLALAFEMKVATLTADQAWIAIAHDVGVEVRMIR